MIWFRILPNDLLKSSRSQKTECESERDLSDALKRYFEPSFELEPNLWIYFQKYVLIWISSDIHKSNQRDFIGWYLDFLFEKWLLIMKYCVKYWNMNSLFMKLNINKHRIILGWETSTNYQFIEFVLSSFLPLLIELEFPKKARGYCTAAGNESHPLDLPNIPSIIHEWNNDFIQSPVYFLRSQDPGPALIAFPMRDAPHLDRDSSRAAIPMESILLFDGDFASMTASIVIASHLKFWDLAMQAGRRLRLDNSFTCDSIQAKPSVA
jgi:hypothetical protein